MTHVTCRLTAKNRDQLRNPTLGNWVWATFTFYLPCLLLICILCLSHAVKAGGSGDVWCGGCSESGSGQDGDWRFMYNTASVVTEQTDEYSWAAQYVLSLDTDHCTLQFTAPPGIQVKQELLPHVKVENAQENYVKCQGTSVKVRVFAIQISMI